MDEHQFSEPDRAEILQACRAVAKATRVPGTLYDVSALERQAQALQRAALTVASAHQSIKPDVVVRAVHYLAYVHAIPPLGEGVDWFQDMLFCLLELISPNARLPSSFEPLLMDIEAGIAGIRANCVTDTPR